MEVSNPIPNIQSVTFDGLMRLIDDHSIFAITDDKGVIVHANNKFVELSKYPREELIGNTHSILRSDEHSDEFFAELWHTITSGDTWSGEIKNRAKDGTYYWLKTSIRPMFSPRGDIIAYVSLRTDITAQKRAAEQACIDKEKIKKQNKELREKDELLQIKNLKLETELLEKQKEIIQHERMTSIGLLASRMSHDMRNPLSIIQISLENIRTMQNLDSKTINQFEKIERATQRMTHQIDNVLDFVKEQSPTKHKIMFSKILSHALDLMIVPEKVELITPKNDIEVIADKKLFSTVLINLIYNSIQEIENQGTIEIAINETNDKNIINIIDSGKGIPKENLEKLFDPLYTTKQQGTGLGLASVKSIIESHRGTVSVTSPPTVFSITLPKVLDENGTKK